MVLVDLTVGVTEEEIKVLIQIGFAPEGITRSKRIRGRTPMPMMLIKLPREQKEIYRVNKILALEVVAEPLKSILGMS